MSTRRRSSSLKPGRSIPIHEPGLDALIKRNVEAGRLKFTTDAAKGVDARAVSAHRRRHASGRRRIGRSAPTCSRVARLDRSSTSADYKVVITKSTVPVGHQRQGARAGSRDTLDKRNATVEYDVVSNPEFLKEGAAIEDFMQPDRVVVGTDNPRITELAARAL